MTPFGEDIVGTAAWISLVLVVMAMCFATVRIVLGPSTADRVVALDMMALLAIAFIGVFAVLADTAALLDVAIALALVAFLGTVAFARYVERRAANGDDEEHDGAEPSAEDRT